MQPTMVLMSERMKYNSVTPWPRVMNYMCDLDPTLCYRGFCRHWGSFQGLNWSAPARLSLPRIPPPGSPAPGSPAGA